MSGAEDARICFFCQSWKMSESYQMSETENIKISKTLETRHNINVRILDARKKSQNPQKVVNARIRNGRNSKGMEKNTLHQDYNCFVYVHSFSTIIDPFTYSHTYVYKCILA